MNHRLNLFLGVIVLLAACSEAQPPNNSSDVDTDPGTEVAIEQNKLEESTTMAPIVRDTEQDSIDHFMSIASPFLNEGCCLEKLNRVKPCCCESVFEQYQMMIQSDNSKVAEVSMTDPILADCRRLMPKKFDALENPPTDEAPEDIF